MGGCGRMAAHRQPPACATRFSPVWQTSCPLHALVRSPTSHRRMLGAIALEFRCSVPSVGLTDRSGG
jgi:hypothetical protein